MYLYHLTLEISYFKWGQKYSDQGSAHIQLLGVCVACFLKPSFSSPAPWSLITTHFFSAFNFPC